MSDENSIGLQTDPNDISNIEKLIASVNKLDNSLQHLASAGQGMSDLKQMMVQLQATMVTGFTEMAALAAKSGERMVAERVKSNNQLVAEEEKAWEKLFFTSQANLSKIEAAQEASDARRLAAHAAASLKVLEQDAAAENKRAATLQSIIEKRDTWEAEARARLLAADAAAEEKRLALDVAAENKRAASLQAVLEKQDLWMAEERGRQLAAEQALQDKRLAIQVAAAEKQRALNATFLASPLTAQIGTAEKASVYGSLGGDAAAKFGTAAAAADLSALRAQYAALPAAVRNSSDAINLHNKAMDEGHALARGLSGSLGALWLTYGSLVPLAAGAAIGASLKNIIEVGKDVEYSLKFVEALGNAPVKIDDFLRVTDGTVVSVKEAAEGMRALAQNGLNAVQSLQILPTILNLAVVGEMSVGAAALSATGVLSAFNLQLADAGRVGDVFAQAAASSNTSVSLMAESMKQASTVASLYHVSLEETAAALGELAKINITGSAAGTAFTNMMTGLYAPTAKAEKALKQLQVTTDDGQGGLKNSVVLLGDLRTALSQYDEKAQTVFLNDIFTARGTKAASTLLNNLEEYKLRIEDAANSTGFMSAAVAKLEDSTEGAFRRMKNNISGSLVEAFTSSSPALQALITDLGTIAGSKAAVQTLTSLADAALRLTSTLVEHAKAISLAALAYISLRAAASLAAAATVQATESIAAGFLAANASAVALSGGLRLLVMSLGWISVALTAAVIVWDIFISKTSEVEKADQRLRNSIDTNIEFLERETKALEERNKAWNPETQRFDKPMEEQATPGAALQRYQAAQDALSNLGAPKGMGDQAWYDKQAKALTELEASKQVLWKETAMQESLSMGLSEERSRKEKAAVLDQISNLVKKGETETTIAGKVIQLDEQGNAKSREIALSAKAVQDQLLAGTITTKQAQTELTSKTQEYNAALKSTPAKENKDALNARLEGLKIDKEILAVRQKTQELSLVAQNKAGGLGDLGLLKAQNDMAKDKVQASIDAAKASIAEVQGVENKRAAEQKYTNQLKVGKEQAKQLDVQYAIGRADVFRKMSEDEVKFEAKTLVDRGAHIGAFLKEYEASYGRTISNVQDDLKKATDDGDKARLQSYLDYLAKLKEAGTTAAIGKSLTESLGRDLAGLQGQLTGFVQAASGQAGLASIFTAASDAADAYAAKLPRLLAAQGSLQALATAHPEQPKLQEQATAELDKILAKGEEIRNQWVSVGTSIGQALTTAFGSGGTALGQLLSATIAYGAKKDQIADIKNKAPEDDPVAQLKAQQKAAYDLSNAQIASYAKMAGAAKGFFKEGSTGYKVMGDAEKALAAIQLVETLRVFAVKSTTLMSLLGLKVATDAEATASEGAYTIASLAMSAARTAVKGIEALATALTIPPPLSFIAFAATAALLVGLGLSARGGSAPASASQRQATVGTGLNPDGTVNGGGILGDTAAKSESISKSLDIIAKDSGLGLAHTISMDASLKTLVANIGGLTSLLVQGTNLASKVAPDTVGTAQNVFNKLLGNQSIGEKLTGGLLGKIVGGIFGGATSVSDVGLKVNSGSLASMLAGGASVSQYTDTLTKGGLFSSDKTRTNIQTLGSEINDQFSKIIQGLSDTVTQSATALGLGGDAFAEHLKSFVVDIGQISTKGLTGEQIQTALQNAFSKLGDDMAKFGVDGLQKFQQVGEGYLQTLSRVANDYIQVTDVLSVLGKSFNTTGLAAVDLSESLITAAGGLDKLTSGTSFFVQNFLTEAEQIAPIAKSVQAALSSLGVSNVTTIDQYKQLVEQQDLSTAAGQNMYASLLNLAPQFKQVADYTAELSGTLVKSAKDISAERKSLQDQLDSLTMSPSQQAAKARAGISAENLALYDQLTRIKQATSDLTDGLTLQGQIYAATGNAAGSAAVLEQQHLLALQGLSPTVAALTKELWAAQAAADVVSKQDALNSAYQAQSSALQTNIDKLKAFQKTLLDLKTSLNLGELSTLTPEKKLAEAKSVYESTLAAARGGDATAQSGLSSAAQAFLAADRAYNASNPVYAADAQKVQDDLSRLANATGTDISLAQQQLNTMTQQVSHLITINNSITSGFDKLANAISALQASLAFAAAANAAASLPTSGFGGALPAAGFGGDPNAIVSKDTSQQPYDFSVREVSDLYQSILGRAPDAPGLAFWVNNVRSGTPLTTVAGDMYKSPEYLATHGGAHALGGIASGYALVGETGPEVVQFKDPGRVYTAQQTAGMFAGGNGNGNEALLERMDAFVAEAKADKIQREAIAKQQEEAYTEMRRAIDALTRATRAS